MLSNKQINHYLKKIDPLSDQILSNSFEKLNTELQAVTLNPIAKLSLKALFKESFRSRKRYNSYISKHSYLNILELNNPIFVIGLPRAGTTYLHNLLIHFLDRDGLEFWELSEPIPYFSNSYVDAKFRKMRTFVLFMFYRIFIPNLQLMHPIKINSYEECWHLFKTSLGIYNLDFQFGLSNFGDWVRNNTIDHTYTEYKMMLKIISQSKTEKNIIILYTIVDNNLAKYLTIETKNGIRL